MDVYVANSPSFKVDPNTVASDAFGRMRVSTPENVFDSKNLPDKNPLFWTEYQAVGAAAAAWQVNKSQVNLTITGASQTSIRQTKEYFTYQPGKSLFVKMTGYAGTSDVLVLSGMGLTGTSASYPTMSWREFV